MTVRQLTKPEVEGEDVSRLFAEATHTLFHLPSFNRIVSEVFDTEYAVLGAFDKTGLLGICSTHGVKAGALRRLFHAGPRLYEVPYGGWVVRARKLEPELRNHIPLGICDAFEYWSMPGAEEGVLGGQRFSTAVLELTPAIEAIWQKSIDGKRRNMIRKAEKQGVTVVEGGEELVDAFHQKMVTPTNRLAGITVHPKAYYQRVLREFAPHNEARLFLAIQGERPLAGILVVRTKHYAHYWIGAKGEDVGNLGQGELLQWKAIEWAKRSKSCQYDLCGYEPERLPHIAAFKRDFSSSIVPFYHHYRRTMAYRISGRLGL